MKKLEEILYKFFPSKKGLIKMTLLFSPFFIGSSALLKPTELKAQISWLHKEESKEGWYKEDVIVDGKEYIVHFSDPSKERKVYWIEDGEKLDLETKQKILFTGIMQKFYNEYEKNKESFKEWKEDLEEFYRSFCRSMFKEGCGKSFDRSIEDVYDFLKMALYGYSSLNKLFGNPPTYRFVIMNPEFMFFAFFQKNFIELYFDLPLDFEEALEMYEKISKKNNLKKFVTSFLIEKYKDICKDVRSEWINLSIIKAQYDKWYTENYLLDWYHIAHAWDRYKINNLFDIGWINLIEEHKPYKKIVINTYPTRINNSATKPEVWGFLYNFATGKCCPGDYDNVIHAAFVFMLYDIYKKEPFPLPIEEFFKKPYTHNKVSLIFNTIKNIEDIINSYKEKKR